MGALRAYCRAVGGSKNLKAEGSKKKKAFMEGKFCFRVLPKSGGGRRGQLPPTAHLVPSALGPSIIIYTELELRENQEK